MAAKSCIGAGQLDVCTGMLAKAVDIETSMGTIIQKMKMGQDHDKDEPAEDERLYMRLRTDYFGLRITLVR
jgi:hypothetical protein